MNQFLEDGTSVECCFGNLDLGGVSYVLKERFEVVTNKIVELTNMNEELTSENKQLRSNSNLSGNLKAILIKKDMLVTE